MAHLASRTWRFCFEVGLLLKAPSSMGLQGLRELRAQLAAPVGLELRRAWRIAKEQLPGLRSHRGSLQTSPCHRVIEQLSGLRNASGYLANVVLLAVLSRSELFSYCGNWLSYGGC